ncbi:type VII toxin-antitoxin system HepT family RNase toxin [Pyrococcus horikoshii]|uniref:type VII toxin-antitoxin system HepT family RNase toxin n=1 Tax=Pyrococcus horikoshii TaxID=53953 RepID=UPI00373AE406
MPGSYSECFLELSKIGVISRELADDLSKMAKFRNILLHQYRRIDDEVVYEIIMKDIPLTLRTLREVMEYVENGNRGKDKEGLRGSS